MRGLYCRVSFGGECYGEVPYEELPVDLQMAFSRSASPAFFVKCSRPAAYVADIVGVPEWYLSAARSEEDFEKLVSTILWRVLQSNHRRSWCVDNPVMHFVLSRYREWAGPKGWRRHPRRP